jgi:hypothetical protein
MVQHQGAVSWPFGRHVGLAEMVEVMDGEMVTTYLDDAGA